MADVESTESSGMPFWGVGLLIVALVVIILWIIYLLIRNAAHATIHKVPAGSRDSTLDSAIRERQRILSAPSIM